MCKPYDRCKNNKKYTLENQRIEQSLTLKTLDPGLRRNDGGGFLLPPLPMLWRVRCLPIHPHLDALIMEIRLDLFYGICTEMRHGCYKHRISPVIRQDLKKMFRIPCPACSNNRYLHIG